MDLSGKTKFIISVIGALILMGGVIIGAEDRFENESDAVKTKMEVADLKEVSQEQIDTLQSMQRTNDIISLESLRNQKKLLEKELQRSPDDSGIKDSLERVIDLIEKLENKIYN